MRKENGVKKSYRNWLVKPRVFFLIILLHFLVIYGVAFRTAYRFDREEIDDTLTHLKVKARFLAGILYQHHKAVFEILQSYAGLPSFRNSIKANDSREANHHLRALQEYKPAIDVVFFSDSSGKIKANWPPHKKLYGADFQYHGSCQSVSEKSKLPLLGVHKRFDGNLAITVCAPVRDEKGGTLGFLAGTQTVSDLGNLFKGVDEDADAKIILLDQHGKAVWSNEASPGAPFLKEGLDHPSFSAIRLGTQEGKRAIEIGSRLGANGLKFVAFEPLKDSDWMVVVEKDWESIFKSEYGLFLRIAAIASLFFLGSVISLVFLRKSIMNYQESEALRKDSEFFQEMAGILDGIADGLMVHDMEGKIIYLNSTLEQLFGVGKGELLGVHIPDHIPKTIKPEDVEKVLVGYRDFMAGKVPPSITFHLLKDGQEIPFTFAAARIKDGEGIVTRAAVTFTNLSELRKAEEKIRQYTEKLEQMVEDRTEEVRRLEHQRMENEKQAATGRMAARIAHEINNPLAGIKNSFRLIRDSIPPDHAYYKYVGLIEREINRIAYIVLQMYDLHQPEGRGTCTVSIPDMIRDLVVFMNVSKQKLKKGECRVNFETGVNPIIACVDDSSLRQVLCNLLDNAIDASPTGAIVRIRASRMEGNLIITVSDCGGGIPEENRAKIFEPFFTTKDGDEKRGMGLGLSVCKGLVQEMGGVIEFETEIGRGTDFKVTLPLSRQDSELDRDQLKRGTN